MKTHELKTWPVFFMETWALNKRFELRFNDRDFRCGDLVVLREWNPDTKLYTGREAEALIDYVMDAAVVSELMDLDQYYNYVIFSLAVPIQLRNTLELDTSKALPPPGTPEPMKLTPVQKKAPIVFDEEPQGEVVDAEFVVEPDAAEHEKAEIMAAHKEKVRIAKEVCDKAALKVAQAEDQAHKHDKSVAKIAKLRQELEAYQVPDPTADEIERLDRLIEVQENVIEEKQLLLARIASYREALEASQKAEKEVAGLQDKVDFIDALVKALEPGGIPSQMILEALEGLNGYLAEAAAYLFPDRTLQVNGNLGIDLEGTPYTTLSKSAKFRVGVAFQYALARLAGARVLMIDEADILDHIGRVELINFLMTQLYNFDQMLVFFTADHPVLSPVADNWWLENGVIEKVTTGGPNWIGS